MKMHQLLAAVTLSALVGCAPAQKPEVGKVSVRQVETLDPQEIGIGKYVFEAKLPAGKVMVLRRTEERNGRKERKILESIQHTNGDLARQIVLMYDLSDFPFADMAKGNAHVRIRAMGGEANYSDVRCTSKSITPNQVTLILTGEKKDEVRLTYDCFVEDHKDAMKRIPNLPAASPDRTWTFNATYTEE